MSRGEKGHSGRGTQWGTAVSACKPDTPGCQAIEVGCPDDGITGTSHYVGIVLICQDDQQVCFLGHPDSPLLVENFTRMWNIGGTEGNCNVVELSNAIFRYAEGPEGPGIPVGEPEYLK